MADPITLAVVAVGISAAGTVASIASQRKSRAAQDRARQKQDRLNAVQRQREQQEQLRQAQMRRAQIAAAGASQGAIGSSSVQGGQGAVQTQTAGNIQFQNQVGDIQSGISGDLQNAANAQARASQYSGVASLANTAFAATGVSFGQIGESLFGGGAVGTHGMGGGSLAR